MKTKAPIISVVIPVKNGAKTIKNCLEGIYSQTIENIEVIIIDSGSTDGTLEILENYPVKLFCIEPDEFNHGLTRSYGVLKANGEFVVLTVQDAIPSTHDWIEIMLAHFANKKVMGVCGQQIVPHHLDKNPLEWFRPYSKPVPRIVEFEKGEFQKLKGKEQHKYCGWDDVTAMYRKSALLETPFLATSFGEDALWAKKALSKGYRLVYDANAKVYHYHHYNFKLAFRRTYTVHYHTILYFNYIRKYENFFNRLIKVFYQVFIKKHAPQKKTYWTWYNIKIIMAHYIALYVCRINNLIFNTKGKEKMHKFWVGRPPQAKN